MLLRVILSLVYLWYKQRIRSEATAFGGSTPEARVNEIATQIATMAQNCPVSSQTLLDMGFAIRNFKHSTVDNYQKFYREKASFLNFYLALCKFGQISVELTISWVWVFVHLWCHAAPLAKNCTRSGCRTAGPAPEGRARRKTCRWRAGTAPNTC